MVKCRVNKKRIEIENVENMFKKKKKEHKKI